MLLNVQGIPLYLSLGIGIVDGCGYLGIGCFRTVKILGLCPPSQQLPKTSSRPIGSIHLQGGSVAEVLGQHQLQHPKAWSHHRGGHDHCGGVLVQLRRVPGCLVGVFCPHRSRRLWQYHPVHPPFEYERCQHTYCEPLLNSALLEYPHVTTC